MSDSFREHGVWLDARPLCLSNQPYNYGDDDTLMRWSLSETACIYDEDDETAHLFFWCGEGGGYDDSPASNACTLSQFHKIECEAVNVQHSQTNNPFHQKHQMSMFK